METATGAVSNSITGLGIPVTYASRVDYPYNCVVLIETSNPAGQAYFGSGVIIGPHTILTASHLLWDSTYQSEANQVWLYPGYNQYGVPYPPGSLGPLSANLAWHNNIVGNVGENKIKPQSSQDDFAVIDTDYTFPTWINVLLDYGGGSVHVTGYPATANGIQTDNVGNVTKDPNYSLLDYPIGFVSPGNSGGPLWNYFGATPYVVGIVSTAGWATQLTAADWNTIVAWENADSYLWTSPPPPPPPPPPPIVNPVIPVTGSGDFNSNGNPDFVWRSNSGVMSMWEYDATAQQVTTTSLGPIGWTTLASGHFSDANGTSSSSSQMLMDYGPTGLMTLWWVNGSGALTGADLGRQWVNVSYLTAGQFTNLGGAGISNFLVSNNVDHHLYDWWITPQGQLNGIDLGPYWSNVAVVAAGQFTANGGTNLLVSNTVDHHLYDWWITGNTLQGMDLGPYWANVSIVATGQFTTNGGTNFLVSNNIDHHLYNWWISGNTLQGMDLGQYWAGVQLVTVGRFDNNTTNTEILVQNTVDHHLYEWWIIPQGQLTGSDLGAYWNNIQLIGNGHYDNNSAFNELLVRNTVDGHFYEWWIAGNRLSGSDLGAVATSATVAGNSSSAAAGSNITVANSGTGLPPAIPARAASASAEGAGAGTSGGGDVAMAGLPATSSGIEAGMPATSADSTSLLVQSMASFGASAAPVDSTGALPATDPSQQPTLAMTIEQHPAHA
jgi:V8-like Glu-specific endopeptidase